MKYKKQIQSVISVLVFATFIVGITSIAFQVDLSIKPSKLSRKIYTKVTGKVTSPQDLDHEKLLELVAPESGKEVRVSWKDMGKKLIEIGAIDYGSFQERYEGLDEEQNAVLLGEDVDSITFNAENIQFWTNVLWSLGLTQESKVLAEGPMEQNKENTPIENYASTAGWTLGSKPAMELYNSTSLIELTDEQNELVYKIAENIFRPCCGNDTAFPDCNHGMAVLGLIELMVSQDASEEDIYEASLAFNSYAFSSTYISTAAYFQMQGMDWVEVSAKEILSDQFSSGQGAAFISSKVADIPGAPKQGGSCGA